MVTGSGLRVCFGAREDTQGKVIPVEDGADTDKQSGCLLCAKGLGI